MDSWRDGVSQNAQDDLDGLLDAVLPFAEKLIGTYGEFYPFGAAVSHAGESAMTAADPGLGENPPSAEVLTALYEEARASAGGLRAVAFVADVWASGSDAVRVELEHREGVAVLILVPYTRSRFRKTLSLKPMRVLPGEVRIWGDLESS
jgi:hypothetical protein